MRAPVRIRPLRVARDMVTASLPPFGMFAAILVVIFAGLTLILGVAGNLDTEVTVWEQASFAVRYFPLAMGIMIPTAFMLAELSVGATRRDFALGASGYAVVLGLVMATLIVVGLVLEGLIFDAAGAEHGFEMNHLAEGPDQVGLVLLEYTITVTAHVLCGWLIGATYWHTGAVPGTLLLPVTVLPAVAVDGVMDIGWTTGVMDWLGWSSLPATLGVVVAILITAVTAYINYLLIRRVGV